MGIVKRFQPIGSGDLELYVFSGRLPPFPPHFHQDYLMGSITRGKRKFYYSNRNHAMLKGDAVILPPGCVHWCDDTDRAPCEWVCLHLRTDWIEARYGKIKEPVLFQDRSVGSYMEKLAHTGERAIEQVTIRILDNFLRTGITLMKTWNCVERHWEKLRSHMAGEICSPNKLDMLAAVARMGKFDLIRKFNRHYGLTPHSYLLNLRIGQGQDMLRTGMDIGSTAIACGFYDQSHFTRYFKKIIGLTPGKYQRSGAGVFSNE